ncbi:synembryn [Phlebotomus argentipes]|uniref:synembryn n=1 Tax=Phlebotomus argentipes TaxID=94469 RepID=UPI0028932B0E|nr:synembryn [Phlebotomus argentipes]
MERENYEKFTSGDWKIAQEPIKNFVDQNDQKFHFVELTTNGQWKCLWEAIFAHLAAPEAAPIHRECLSVVRILSRDKTYLDQCITDQKIDCLLNAANIGPESHANGSGVVIEALKCLCNLVFNSKKCQEMCLNNTSTKGIVDRIHCHKKHEIEYEIQYFDMKLLFLITALNPQVRKKVREDNGMLCLLEKVQQIMKENQECEAFFDKQVDLLGEILKVLFNLTVPSEASSSEDDKEDPFRSLTVVLRELFLRRATSKEKQHDLWSNCVNLLTSVPSEYFPELAMDCEEGKGFEGQDMAVIDVLLNFLRLRLESMQKVSTQNECLSPILTALVKCVRSSSRLRRYIRSQVLPPLRDVHRRPEDGTELRNYLCRLLTTPALQVRDLVAEFLFVMCKENVGRMIKYTGYGNAAGMFANRGLLGGHGNPAEGYSSDSEDSDTEEYKELQHGINPVLGCYEPKRPNIFEGMTEEQKEYEAMQLVSLMDKLQRQGIMQPGRIGPDGRPVPVDHILELQEELPQQQSDHKRKT